MKLADPVTYTVHVADRGSVRLVDLMRELGVDFAGFPRRCYYRDDGAAVVTGNYGVGQPYYEVAINLGTNLLPPHDGFMPTVVAKEPLPYVTAWGNLYEYESGKLFQWSKRRKDREPVFRHGQGELLFEVLGRAGEKGLRVRLPHRPDKEWVLVDGGIWLDRRPSKLELRLRELRLDNPFAQDHRHPLWAADGLLDYARRERWTLTYDGNRVNWMAIERWEEERQHEDLGVDEAIIALRNGVLTEDTADWGLLSDDLVARYLAADWGSNAPEENLRRMTDLWLIERRMIRSAMRAVAEARRMYARDAFDRLLN